jgi:hypothetical protein
VAKFEGGGASHPLRVPLVRLPPRRAVEGPGNPWYSEGPPGEAGRGGEGTFEVSMSEEVLRDIAAHCRHYAMCKIDYLGTGICPAALKKPFVAYFPQGRMDIYDALARDLIPFSEGLIDIADSCTLCGNCDFQCHFVTGLRPFGVMKALKELVEGRRRKGGEFHRPEKDPVLDRLGKIVGPDRVSNDPAILVTYAHDPFPMTGMRMPRYVAMPGSTEETAALVRLAARAKIPFAVRGNGASVYGQVFSQGLVLDMNRLKAVSVDPQNWRAEVGAGVTSFELQQEARRYGLRANAAEPAATVCGNVICTGTFSTWSASYGLAADNIVDMEFVDRRGRIFRLSDPGSANLMAYRHGEFPTPGVCTRAWIRLHPVTNDEEGLLVPFGDLENALNFVRELSVRRIGLSLAVLGRHYLATFLSPSSELSAKVKKVLPEDLGIRFAVFVIADLSGCEAVRRMAGPVIDEKLLNSLILGLPNLVRGEWLGLVRETEGRRPPYELLCRPEVLPVIESALDPSPETIAGAVDPDLRSSYAALYRRREFTDPVWLTSFRIVSARMGRDKHIIAFVLFIPLDSGLVRSICERFSRTAGEIGLDHDYGFLTPLDFGKRAVLEYDYYIDQTDPLEKQKSAAALAEIVPWLDGLALGTPGFTWMKTLFGQGFVRKESFLYRAVAGGGGGMTPSRSLEGL